MFLWFDKFFLVKNFKILTNFAATLVIVMVTVVICGGSTVSLLTFFDIPLGVEDEEDKSPLSSSATPNHNYSSMADAIQVPVGSTPAPDKSMAAQAWSGFDSKYMKPLLTHSNPTLMETLPDCCSSMARVLTSTQQLARHPQMVNGMATNSAEDEEPAVFNQVESNDEIITVHTQEPEEKKNEELKQRFPSDI